MNRPLYRPIGLLMLLIILSFPGIARPEQAWYWYYDLARRELKNHQYQLAIQNLKKAIQMRPEASDRARTTGIFAIQYFPYYHLAIAYYQTGQYQEAYQALERSFEQGAIFKNKKVLREARGLRELLKTHLSPPTPPPTVTKPKNEPKPASTPPETRPKPAGSEKTPEMTPREPAPTEVKPNVSSESPQPSKASPTQPPRTDIAPSSPPIIPPRIVAQAFRHIEHSQYPDAIRVLQQALRHTPDHPVVNFLLGYCYAALYYLGGEKEPDLLSRARTAFRKARDLPANFRNNLEVLVSPKILSIYHESVNS